MAKQIDSIELAKIYDARDTLCDFCNGSDCDTCVITNLVNEASCSCEDNDTEEEVPQKGYVLCLILKLYLGNKSALI